MFGPLDVWMVAEQGLELVQGAEIMSWSANGVDFGLLHFVQGFQVQKDVIAQFDILGHEFSDCGTLLVTEG
jgi:hypothetical protein